jgi:hypothetical protein
VQLTLALGLWNTGGAGRVSCRIGVMRPGEDLQFIGEGDTTVADPGEMIVLPLKLTFTFDRPGTYWVIGEFDGQRLAEVPFTVSADAPPAETTDTTGTTGTTGATGATGATGTMSALTQSSFLGGS